MVQFQCALQIFEEFIWLFSKQIYIKINTVVTNFTNIILKKQNFLNKVKAQGLRNRSPS